MKEKGIPWPSSGWGSMLSPQRVGGVIPGWELRCHEQCRVAKKKKKKGREDFTIDSIDVTMLIRS